MVQAARLVFGIGRGDGRSAGRFALELCDVARVCESFFGGGVVVAGNRIGRSRLEGARDGEAADKMGRISTDFAGAFLCGVRSV